MNKEQKALLLINDGSQLMRKAIEAGSFYTEITPCVDGFCHGHIECEYTNVDFPALNATLESAEREHNELKENYDAQILSGHRDSDDNWKGIVVKAHWTGGDDIAFYSARNNTLLTKGKWREFAGI